MRRIIKIFVLKIWTLRNLIYAKSKPGLFFVTPPQLYGLPKIEIRCDTKILLGKNVTLKSNYRSYHSHICAPVKLFVDRPNAKIIIGDNTRIVGTCIHAHEYISIGQNCLIGANTHILDGDGHDLSFENPGNRINTLGGSKPVFIEDNVWIGLNCIILPGVRIGTGSVIGAGSVVSKDIPAMALAGGNPAQVVYIYDKDHQRKENDDNIHSPLRYGGIRCE